MYTSTAVYLQKNANKLNFCVDIVRRYIGLEISIYQIIVSEANFDISEGKYQYLRFIVAIPNS